MMDYISKVESFLDFSLEDFPNEDSLPTDLEFNLKHVEPTLIYEKELNPPILNFFSRVIVTKSELLKLTSLIAPNFTMNEMGSLEFLVNGLVEIYGSDGKGWLFLHDFEKGKIADKTWEGRYWEFQEVYNEIDVSVHFDELGELSLNFYKRHRPWLDEEEEDDDF
ncbi:hypothetical protein ACFOSV_05945 [Algoriphagus namhaensis]|uniref:Uncharacterized protein n=1 Tax=Algoriphagus namhaensis TaxID=915353 RepID=A0ABV8AS07_9BACT